MFYSSGGLVFLVLLTRISGETWDDPWITATDKTNINGDKLIFPESPELESGDEIAILHYTDTQPPHILCETGPGSKNPCLYLYLDTGEQEGTIILRTNTSFDFENSTLGFPDPDKPVKIALAGFTQITCNDAIQPCKSLYLEIENVNDVKPKYITPPPSSVLMIPENTMNETMFVVEAEDTEFPDGRLDISIKSSDTDLPFAFKRIDDLNKWSFGTTKELDFENVRSFILTVVLQDSPDRFGNVLTSALNYTITIQVTDEGDRDPIWQLICQPKSIQENFEVGTEIFRVRAQDADAGIQNAIEYKIDVVTNSKHDFIDYFELSVENNIAVIKATKTMDRENELIQENYNFFFTLTASEVDSCIEHCTSPPLPCRMTLENANDNGPIIAEKSYKTTVQENTLDFIFDIAISDIDQSDNYFNQFRVDIVDENIAKKFEINPAETEGNRTVRIRCNEDGYLDYENMESLKFKIKATDKNDENMFSEAELEIFLTDENDNTPEFTEDFYELNVSEDLSGLEEDKNGHYLGLTLQATDNDKSDEFGTMSLVYSLQGGPSNVIIVEEIDQNGFPQGKLYATGKFDFETDSSILLQAIVKDNKGSVSNENKVDITFIIEDRNDELPNFETFPDDVMCVYENSPEFWPEGLDCNPEKIIFTGVDPDASASLIISINWDGSSATKNNIKVDDPNLYKDTFIINQESRLETVTATLGVSPDKFIDKEEVDILTLEILVTDKNGENPELQETSKVLVLNIEDVDDTKPVFTSKPDFTINEEQAGQKLEITITDADQYVEQQYTFQLKEMNGTPEGLFNLEVAPVDSNIRYLVSDKPIDREDASIVDLDGKLSYTITVKDKGNNENSQEIIITVKDLNDCYPYFKPENYDMSVSEDSSDGAVVGSVIGLDEDVTDEFNTKSLVYYINYPKNVPFTIDEKTGQLKVSLSQTQYLDRELEETYLLLIGAQDLNGDGQGLKAEQDAEINVTILDVDDEPPRFINTENYENVEIDNTRISGSVLLNFEGADPDKNPTFTFEIIEKEPDFPCRVEGTGLVLEKQLNEFMKSFTYTVQIKDNVGMNDTLSCNLTIYDLNDKAPEFSYPEEGEDIWINEDSEIGKPMIDFSGRPVKVNATDADVDPRYNKVTYGLLSESNWFKLNSETGIFTLNQNLSEYPFENPAEDDTIPLTVQAYDLGQTNTATKTITLRVQRDYPPKFSQLSYSYDVVENTQLLIPLVNATDKNNIEPPTDDWIPQEICYFIIGGNEKEIFSVGLKSNILSNNIEIDRDCGNDCARYNLIIAATNFCASPPVLDSLSAEEKLNVTLYIQDVNDVEPRFMDGSRTAGITGEDKNNDIVIKLQATDPDLEDNPGITGSGLNFGIGEIIIGPESIDLDISVPFILSANPNSNDVEIKLNFNPTTTMKGYFEFNITVTDKVGHSSAAEVKIVMIAPEHVCLFSFENSKLEIEAKEQDIVDIFERILPYIFNIDRITGPSFKASLDSTGLAEVQSHFLNKTTIEPIDRDEVLVIYDRFQTTLQQSLHDINITLRLFEVEEEEEGTNLAVTMIVLIVSTILFGFMFSFLLIAYCIRTNILERKVKAMETAADVDTNKNTNEKIYLTALQENVPGSNEFAEEGANPIWQVAMESNDFEDEMRFDDNESQSSGDSILIGVEEDKDFRDYKDLDVDMDLYNVVNKRYKTIDDYQAPSSQSGVFTLSSGKLGGNPLYNSDDEEDL